MLVLDEATSSLDAESESAIVHKTGGTYRRLFEKQALGLAGDERLQLWAVND
jgi:hypothetical protein